MWKTIGLLAVGVIAGTGIVLYSRGNHDVAALGGSDASGDLAEMKQLLTALDRRVDQLNAQVEMLQFRRGGPAQQGEAGAAGLPAGEDAAARMAAVRQRLEQGGGPPDMAEMRKQMQQRELERLVQAGFTPERAQWIARRMEELQVAQMQAQYDAQRTGQRGQAVDPELALRKEMGDAEFERYLKATGRPTEVQVAEVLATSAAERSGIKAGDQIVSYNGTRVFDSRELNSLTMNAAAGQSVMVEVKRDGQTVQVSVPSGPLGVSVGGGGPGGGRRGPPGGAGGGFPGGFRPPGG